jgi:AsmA protein
MGRTLKIIAILVGALVALLIAAAIVFALVFDPNDYKDKISAGVKEATGRDLVIEGELELSLFPWLAIEIGRTELGNAPGFDDTPFASFDSARLSVQVLPVLLRREIVVGTAALDGMSINLQVRADGTGNWEDFGEAGEVEADEAGPDGGGATGTVDVVGIAVTNASLTYADAASDSRIELLDLNFTTGGIASADESTIVIDGMDIKADIIGVADVPVSLEVALPAVSVDTKAQAADIGQIDVQVMSVNLQADVEPFSYAGDPEPQAQLSVAAFSPSTLMAELGIAPPETADPDALGKLTFAANASVKASSINLSDLKLVLDDTTFTGKLGVPRDADGAIELDLAGDSIDLARYMAPAAEADAGEAQASETVEIPADLIRPLNARGNLSIARASLGDILFENVTVGLNAADGVMRIHPIAADFFDGGYRGDIRINASGDVPSISVSENIKDVNLASMARAVLKVENITGMVNGTFNLGGRGADMNAIRRDLDGNMSLELRDGAWEGVDVWYEMRKARAFIKGEPEPDASDTPRTQFSSMKATGVVTNGVMQNDDFYAELPFMQVNGRGSVNFVEATVDYSVRGRVLEKPEFMTEVSPEELEDFTSAVIPFTITGPLADPSIRPDIEAILKEKVEEEAKKLLLDKLLGGGEEPPAEGVEPAEGEEPAQEEPEEEKDIEDQLKDEAKKRLRDLLGG